MASSSTPLLNARVSFFHPRVFPLFLFPRLSVKSLNPFSDTFLLFNFFIFLSLSVQSVEVFPATFLSRLRPALFLLFQSLYEKPAPNFIFNFPMRFFHIPLAGARAVI